MAARRMREWFCDGTGTPELHHFATLCDLILGKFLRNRNFANRASAYRKFLPRNAACFTVWGN